MDSGHDGHYGALRERLDPYANRLRFSGDEREQRGAMEIYTGVMRLFRNAAGHRLSASVTQERALQFVVMVDLLLALVGELQVGAAAD